MNQDKNTKWTGVVILAAIVAALTTVAVLVLRARAKKKAMFAYNDTIDYDFDDCCCEDCGEDDGSCDVCDNDPVQIPHTKPEDEPSDNEPTDEE